MPKKAIERALRRRVVTADGCWVFTGYKNRSGYGQIQLASKSSESQLALVHRLAYSNFVGPIPDGLYVCHRCDNPACFNPHHLFVGDALTNNLDAKAKGRTRRNGYCKGCGCQRNERTEGCGNCYSRHRMRELRELRETCPI